jgi:type III pantothenate kinase
LQGANIKIFSKQSKKPDVVKKSDLVIDLGNTRMKVALFVNGALDGVLWLSKDNHSDMEHLIDSSGATRAIVSAVTQYDDSIFTMLQARTNAIRMESNTPAPIKIDYNTPHTLGTDRIANACGVAKLYPGKNVLVIDFGTCVKYDLVEASGVFCGGAIAPGLRMRFEAMHSMTGKLPLVSAWEPSEALWPGKSTTSSMVTGVIQGIQAEIAQYITTANDYYEDLTVITTGGDYAFFEKAFKNIIFAHPYLTLEGLHEILKYNLD